jgi:hypothetical protein
MKKLLFAAALCLAALASPALAGPGDPLNQQTPCEACHDGCANNYAHCETYELLSPAQCFVVQSFCDRSCDTSGVCA